MPAKPPIDRFDNFVLRPEKILAEGLLEELRSQKEDPKKTIVQPTPFKKNGKTGFALSGGGAKGSFQVGALQFLMEMRGIKPDCISGTSVGAVNGAKLAEGDAKPSDDPNYEPGLLGLVKIWRGLKKDTDMATPIVDFQKLVATIKDEMVDIGADLVGIGVLAGMNPLLFAPGIGCLAADIADSVDEIKKVVSNALYAGGIYSLRPVRAMIGDKKKWRPELFANSKIETMICWVGMLSGKTFYVDNKRHLYVAPNFKSHTGEVASYTDAIHASSAIPLVFKPPVVKGTWGGKPFAEVGYDGGVTEIAPVEVLAERGANQVFAIVCAPEQPADIFTGKAGDATASLFKTYKAIEFEGGKFKEVDRFLAEHKSLSYLLTVGTRALDIATGEILEDDLKAKLDELHVIRPYVIVHDTQQIDPDLIQINADHGWMCAYDAEIPRSTTTQPRSGGGTPRVSYSMRHTLARQTNTAITLARRDRVFAQRGQKMVEMLRNLGMLSPKFANKTLEAYKEIEEKNKKAIYEGVQTRRSKLGIDSVPVVAASSWDD